MKEINKNSMINLKNLLIFLLLIFLLGYVLYDVSLRFSSRLQEQGYFMAINEIIIQGGECDPFRVYLGDRYVDLINTACLYSEEEVTEDVIGF